MTAPCFQQCFPKWQLRSANAHETVMRTSCGRVRSRAYRCQVVTHISVNTKVVIRNVRKGKNKTKKPNATRVQGSLLGFLKPRNNDHPSSSGHEEGALHVDSAVAKQLENEQQNWIELLKSIVAVVTFLAERGHPFRGHTELFGQKDNGNYLGLLDLLSQFDPFLAEHIRRYGNKGRGQVSYLSSTICEEFIKVLSDRVKAKIIAEIKKAKYYSTRLSIDSTPDIARIDQLSIVIRYVRIDGQPVERFMAFIDIEKHEGKYVIETLKYFLDECGIKLEDCRGQMYDNARNMSGTYSGVQARFHQDFDYDDENKRAKKRKLFHDETPTEVKVSDYRENFRVNTYLVITDRLLSEIKKRKAACTNVYERFGVLTEIR
ncbi:hypothetical protein LSAT2_018226 [Lamellibrachia satsuma]|nr:hypothetical protein LSAT2_018226 [Lamellibrachia satsuma]